MKVPAGWDIPLAIRMHLGDRSGRQREIVAEEHLLLVLHRVPDSKTRDREGVYFWRTPFGEWRTTDRGQAKAALGKLIADYEAAITALEERHDKALNASQTFAVLEQLGPLNRAARNLSDTLLKGRDSIESIDAKRELQSHSDHAGDVARSCELLHMDARNALDFHIAKQSEIQAKHSREVEKATHRLNTMATVFLPLTAVASVFGMNLQSGLESAPPWMFWAILIGSIATGLVISEGLAAFRLRSRRSD